jgi:hypothetical protein
MPNWLSFSVELNGFATYCSEQDRSCLRLSQFPVVEAHSGPICRIMQSARCPSTACCLANQFVSLEKQGIKHLINLRPSDEQNWDERQYVASLGLSYHLIPVAGANGVTEPNAILLAC